jgi:DNA-binding NtrC family response regulator
VETQFLRISFLSCDSGLGAAIARALGEGFELRTFSSESLAQLQDVLPKSDVLFVDLRQSHLQTKQTGLRLLEEISAIPGHSPVLALCDAEDRAFQLRAMEHGATDFVHSPPNIVELRMLFHREHRVFAAERELKRMRLEVKQTGRLHELLGSSPVMQELFALAQRVGPCDVNVLITGETGTGKELLARAIHQMGPRSGSSLVGFSCANLPEALVEDELFGHEKGAFTGAMASRQGRVEAANHGTLFLDEIGDLGIGLQPKLLRVLQEKTFERLGSNKTIQADVRLISATNRNLQAMVKEGKFREDLFYRVNVVELNIPPLRERRDDIPLLVQHFLEKSCELFHKKPASMSPAAMKTLERYDWPGNVRELQNVIQRAVVLSESPIIELSHLPDSLRKSAQENVPLTALAAESEITDEISEEVPLQSVQSGSTYEKELRRFKRELVTRTLRENGWRKAESARSLGVARGYLHRLINQLDIKPEEENSKQLVKHLKLPSAGPVM